MFSLRSSLLTLLFVVLSFPVHARSLVVLGDSLSAAYQMPVEQGWVALLEQRLQTEGYDLEVINASVSGDTTQNGLARLTPLLQQVDAEIVIIELGANDGLRGTPPFAIQQNLSRLITMAQDGGAEVVLLGMQLPPNYGAAYGGQFAAIYPQLADKKDVILVPEFMQEVALRPELMMDDGLHPNSEGQPYLLDKVWGELQPLLD